MQINQVPTYDRSDNPTNCCPRFDTQSWDDQELHFEDKLFVQANVRSLFHIPLNMGTVFTKTSAAIEKASARKDDEFLVMSIDPSMFRSEHYFSVTKEVPGQKMVTLSGNYLTKVFEGPYKDIAKWHNELEAMVKSKGKTFVKSYFFYTTCPKCAKFYGKNYVVGIAQID